MRHSHRVSGDWTTDPATWPATEHDRHIAMWRVEHALRERLLRSPPETRDAVTLEVYDELFREIPWHPVNVASERVDARAAYEDTWFRAYRRFAPAGATVMDLGCGNGDLIARFAGGGARCIGVDVSEDMIDRCRQRHIPNARFVAAGVIRPPVPAASVDLAVSRQVVEHLHPDDIPAHVAAVHDALAPGGVFLIETPNAATGPWDVSRGITDEPTGFHLREFTHGDLAGILRDAGFTRVSSPLVGIRGLAMAGALSRALWAPARLLGAADHVVSLSPRRQRERLARLLRVSGVTVAAFRPA